ncbi:MAG: sialidase family protein [Sphaerochaetaceae bacterium]
MRLPTIQVKKEFIVPFEDRPTDSAHASTLLELKDGSVLVSWFGGSWEKDPNVSIWLCKRDSEGLWGKPYVADDKKGVAMWNPVLFRTGEGRILLFYKVGATIEQWKTYRMDSLDEGKTWSESRELVSGDISGGRGPVKNKPILLSDGKTIIAPASVEGECWDAFVDISTDGGQSWEKSEYVPQRHASYNIQMVDQPYEKHRIFGKGMIQPSLWEDAKGILHMFCRTGSSAIFRSDSVDKGRSWSLAYDTGLPNNNSGLDLVRLSSGTLILAYNPTGNLPNYYKGPRTPLSLARSEDNGENWTRFLDLETEPGGYAYPAIIEAHDGSILVTYTHRRERICFCRVEMEY